MQIALVGCGSLASSLGPALLRLGHHVTQVYSRTEQSAALLAEKIHCNHTTDLHSLTEDADLYFICLKDDALIELADQITAHSTKALFVHVAGCVPMDILHCQHKGVMWPIHGFSIDKAEDDWSDIPLTVEASDQDSMQALHTIADGLSNHVFHADSSTRPKIHLAAEFCCNFTNHCYELADSLLQDCGLPFSTMENLIYSAIGAAFSESPHKAQTGPARRHDTKTMDYDRSLLRDNQEMLEIYNIMSNNIQKFFPIHDQQTTSQ